MRPASPDPWRLGRTGDSVVPDSLTFVVDLIEQSLAD
jgi:hypothetical protein